MFVTLERSYCRSLASAIRDAIIVGVFPTWAAACESADEYADDCLSAVAVCTETGRVYFAGGAETVSESIHEPSDAFEGMSAGDYLAMKA